MSALFSGTVGPAPAVILLFVAVSCAVTDLWKGKIYNAITYPAMAVGFVLAIVQHGAVRDLLRARRIRRRLLPRVRAVRARGNGRR